MSELAKSVGGVVGEALADARASVVTRALSSLPGLDEAAAKHPRVRAAAEDALALEVRALSAKDPDQAREFAAGAETAMRRVRVLLAGEAVAVSDSVAAAVVHALRTAASVLVDAGSAIVGAVVSGVVSGAIAGVMGKEADGSSSPAAGFPGS